MSLVRNILALVFVALAGQASAQSTPNYTSGVLCATTGDPRCTVNPVGLNQAFGNKADYPYLGPVGGVQFYGTPTTGQVLVATGPLAAAWQSGLPLLGIGPRFSASVAPDTLLEVNANSAAVTGGLPSGIVGHFVGANAAAAQVVVDSFGGPTVFLGRRAQGTVLSPTPVGGQFLTEFMAGGYDGSAYATTGGLLFSGTETWNTGAHGTGFRFQATTNGTTTSVTPGDFNVSNPGDWTFTAPAYIAPASGSFALSIAPPAASLATGVVVSQSLAGSSGFPAGNALNLFLIASDNAVLTGATSFANYFEVSATCCGSLAQGGRQVLGAFMTINSPDSASNANKNWLAGIYGATASVNVGGTNTGVGSNGYLYGTNPYAFLASGATNWGEVAGEEINVAVQTGASVRRKSILHLAYFCPGTCDAIQGTVDGAIIISASTGVTTTAKNIFLLSNDDGVLPVGSTTSIMSVVGGGAISPANGIDFSGFAGFSGCAFKSPGSFCVDGSGDISTGGNGFVAALAATGVIFAKDAAAPSSGGAQAYSMSSTAALGIYYGTGNPTVSAAKGSIYLENGSGQIWINASGSTTWTQITVP